MRWEWIGEHSLQEAQDSAESLASALEMLVSELDCIEFFNTINRRMA